MTSRAWHIVRWFGFLAIGLVMAIGSGLRFRQNEFSRDSVVSATAPPDDALVMTPPRAWLAPEAVDGATLDARRPPALASTIVETTAPEIVAPPHDAFDPESPEAEQAIDELGMALAGFDVQNVQFRTIEEQGNRRFVFSCDVPTDRGAQTFAGEGPDPPSAARHALSRIRSWASAPESTTLR